MKASIVKPQKRLDRIIFDPRSADARDGFRGGHYKCAHCGEALEISGDIFLRSRQFGESATLPSIIAGLFQRSRPISRSFGESALDLQCPVCRAPARLIYERWPIGPESWGYTVKTVLEIADWKTLKSVI